MKIEIVEYKPEHIIEIMEKHPRSKELYWAKYSDWGKWLTFWHEGGPAYTLIIDDEIIGSAGVLIYNNLKGEAWMVLSELFYQYRKETFRTVRDGLNKIISDNKLKLVESFILTNFTEAERWMIHLGFINKIPPPFGPNTLGPRGEAMYLYVRKIG